MIKQICILTKSYKHGGYCVAGIDINTKEWIRLVNSDNPNTDEIRKEQMFLNGKSIECLDVVEYDFIKNIPNSCQTENWLLNISLKPKYIKSMSIEELANIIKIENDDFFIFNNANLLNENEISNIKRSLYIFHVQNLKIEAATYESYGEIRFRYKCSFDYKDNQYTNISLTDPIYRDVAQDGTNLSNALIIASLPCIPYNDNLFYKFVAKIIPIDEQLATYIESINEDNVSVSNILTNSNIKSPFVKFDLVVQTEQTPGIVLFNNYEQLKTSISNGVSYYSDFEYTLENYQIALKHHNELKYVKNILEKTKREIVKSYNTPLEIVEKRIDELINLIKVPFKKVDTFIKQNEKNSKKYEIYIFAKEIAISNGLQEHMEHIFRSPAFFDIKWLNASCSKTNWKSAVSAKLRNAVKDINHILSIQNDNKASILANYYQTLSMEKVEEFISSLKQVSVLAEKQDSKILSNPINNTIPDEGKKTNEANKTVNNLDLKDSEVLDCVANSVNPYTGEVITGIDNLLKIKLKEIAERVDFISCDLKNKKSEEIKTIKRGDFDVIVDNAGNIITDIEVLKVLRSIRSEIATQIKLPPYCVCSNKTLVQLATYKPKTKEEFLAIKGVGEKWYDNYAHYFIDGVK